MNKQDFNRLNEIAKELNDIRLRNDLNEVQLTAERRETTYYDYHKEWSEVQLLTRGEDKYRDCKFAYMKQYEDNEIINMDYEEYVNYR